MDTSMIRAKLEKLKEEQEKRAQQVGQWQEQIDKLSGAIRQTKEAHDFTRGQIVALEEVLEDQAADVEAKVDNTTDIVANEFVKENVKTS